MAKSQPLGLSRRERQIMDVIYQHGAASAGEIHAALPDAPSYSTVRTLLRVLKDKGHVQHKQHGPRYVYSPTVPATKAKRRALEGLVATFFEGSAEKALVTLLDMASARLSRSELEQLRSLIDRVKEREQP